MKIHHVIFDKSAFGITQRSLKILRNELSERVQHLIQVLEVPTNDLCSTYIILDPERREAIFTGDGFRMDGRGEGGAGHKTAETIFRLFGLTVLTLEPIEKLQEVYTMDDDDQALRDLLLRIANQIADETDVEFTFMRPAEQDPEYIR